MPVDENQSMMKAEHKHSNFIQNTTYKNLLFTIYSKHAKKNNKRTLLDPRDKKGILFNQFK